MSKIIDTYKNIAREYILTNDIQSAYRKYHPKVSEASLKVLPYNLLDNIRFNKIKEDMAREMQPNLEDKIQSCLNNLYDLSLNATKQADRITAGTNYLKFTMGEVHKTKDISEEKHHQSLLNRFTNIGLQ